MVVLLVFSITLGIGFWLGHSLVVRGADDVYEESRASNSVPTKQIITLLEVDDLTAAQPTLISIWNIHLTPGNSPKLGFTPVAAEALPDEPNFSILEKFSMDDNHNPSAGFLQALRKINPTADGYIILDNTSTSEIMRWFLGTESAETLNIENHTMTEYGQVLRSFCRSLANEAEKTEFPWSIVNTGHFKTSLSFNQVFINLGFLTNSPKPQCVMVPIS